MLNHRSIAALLGSVLASLLCGCSAPRFGVEPSIGRLEARGDVSIAEDGASAALNSFRDLGVAGTETTFGVRADFKWGVPHLTVASQGASWSGTGFASELGDITGTDVAVQSDLDLRLHRLLVTFDLIPGRRFEAGLGFGVSALDFDWHVRELESTNEERVREILPVPVLALRLGASVWKIDLEALIAGIAIRYENNKADYLDADISARVRVFDVGRADGLVVLGYRRVALDVEVEDDEDTASLDMTFDGPYLGLRIRF